MFSRKTLSVLSILAGLLVAMIFVNRSVVAFEQKSATDCNAVDLVLLIDQSGSMSGINKSKENNDPDEFRVKAARLIMNRLYFNVRTECKEAIHRVGIVNFGRTASVILPMTEIRHELSKTEFDSITQKVRSEYLIDTDPQLAISEATKLLNGAPSVGNLVRKRAVVLLTDGNPCVYNLGCRDAPEPNTFDVAKYMDQLQEQINRGLPWYSTDDARSTFFWVVALNSSKTKYLEGYTGTKWKEITASHGGDLIALTTNGAEIPDKLNVIYGEIMGTGGEYLPCGSFYVDPYLNKATFTFHRNDDSVIMKVTVKDRDGGDWEIVAGQLRQGSKILEQYSPQGQPKLIGVYDVIELSEYYELMNPPSGRWEISSLPPERCNEVIKYFEPKTFQATVLSPTDKDRIPVFQESPYYDDSYPRIQVQLEDLDKQPIKQDSAYPINVEANITDSKGLTHTLDFEYSSGVWKSKQPVPAPTPGRYQVSIVGQTQRAEPSVKEPWTVFQIKTTYDVLDIKRFGFQITDPADKSYPLNTVTQDNRLAGAPVGVQVRMVGGDGNPLKATEVLKGDLSKALETVLYGPDGREMERLNLTPSLDDLTRFTGEFRKGQTALDPEGLFRLEVTFKGDYDTDHYAPTAKQPSVTFRRVKVNGIQLQVLAPTQQERLLLHTGFCESTVRPVQFKVSLADMDGNSVPPGTVSPNVATLLSATLQSPPRAGEKSAPPTETLNFALEDGRGPALVAQGAAAMDRAGKYQLQLAVNPGALSPAYTVIEPRMQWAFTREDDISSSPGTCQTAQVSGGLLLALIAAAVVYAVTGGPSGSIALFQTGSTSEILSRGLSSMRVMTLFPIRSKALEEVGIKSIMARRTASLLDKANRAVQVKVVGVDDQLLYDGSLDKGEFQTPLNESMDIGYR